MEITSTQLPPKPVPPKEETPPAGPVDESPKGLDHFAVQLCQLSYAKTAIAIENLAAIGATHVTKIDDQSSNRSNRNSDIFSPAVRPWVTGLGFVLNGKAWIVFRGSDDLDDWSTNFTFRPFFHSGFQSAWHLVQRATRDFAKKVYAESTGIVMTGHSLGGAIATLAASDLAQSDHKIEAVITFGCPRVFSWSKARAFDNTPANEAGETLGAITRRYATDGEPVARVPPCFLGFRHVGRAVDFPDTGRPLGLAAGTVLDTSPLASIRKIDLGVFAPIILPLLLLKALVFGVDRASNHRMQTYLSGFGIFATIFRLPDAYSDSNMRSLPVRPRATLRLFVVAFIGFALLCGAVALSLYWTDMHPVLVIAWLGFAIITARQSV